MVAFLGLYVLLGVEPTKKSVHYKRKASGRTLTNKGCERLISVVSLALSTNKKIDELFNFTEAVQNEIFSEYGKRAEVYLPDICIIWRTSP